jgi:hypothetical protein
MNSMPLDLARCWNTKVAGRTGQIITLLKTLGVPGQMLYFRRLRENGSFWLRKINHLQILEQARWLYRQQIVCVHPDKAGGSAEQAIQLNWTWGEIERRFKQHGHELW